MSPNLTDPGARASARGDADRVYGDAYPDSRAPIRGAIEPVRGYHARGWRGVSVPKAQKAPTIAGWPDYRARADDLPRLFSHDEKLAVILSLPSGELVDIDLDRPEAADLYQASTRAMFGRVTSDPSGDRL